MDEVFGKRQGLLAMSMSAPVIMPVYNERRTLHVVMERVLKYSIQERRQCPSTDQ
ncbi:MAG: hypothetical protein ACRD3Q_16520 [Terriglobales bacterium]